MNLQTQRHLQCMRIRPSKERDIDNIHEIYYLERENRLSEE